MEIQCGDTVTDNYLVNQIKVNNCEDSLSQLMERHSALCFKIIKKYAPSFKLNNINIEEASSQKNFIIWNSAKSFSIEKNVKFSTWLANQVKYFCLNILNKKNKDRLVTTGEEVLDILREGNSPETSVKENIFEFTDNILAQLKDKRIKKIFSLRYSKKDKKPSWCVIADEIKVSTQTAINLHNRGIQIIRKKMDSEKFLDSV